MSTNRFSHNKSPEQIQKALSDLINEFTEVIKYNPKKASAFLNRGVAYHQQRNYDQAIRDYTKAIRLKPEYAEDKAVKSYYDAALNNSIANFNRGSTLLDNRLNEIPDAALVSTQSSFFDLSDLNSLSQTSRKNATLFKPALPLKKLLNLVVRYELNETKIEEAIANGVNPILQEVNALSTRDPSLALKRDHTTDHYSRNRYWSPLEAAYWSGNWELCNMMIERIKTAGMGAAAEEQLREWAHQAYNYDLILMRAEKDTFPQKKIPALIKQQNENGDDKIFQWGDVNGEWQWTELKGNTKELFANLDFPNTSSDQPITIACNQITMDMYDALKKGHTVAHFDLDEYVRVITAFLNKFPMNAPVPLALCDEHDSDSSKIGKAQRKFPAWLAAVWCSNTPFLPLPDFKLLIKEPKACRWKLFCGEDFFDDRLDHISRGDQDSAAAGYGVRLSDLVAMAAACKVITDELGKSMQLLPRESKPTPRLS